MSLLLPRGQRQPQGDGGFLVQPVPWISSRSALHPGSFAHTQQADGSGVVELAVGNAPAIVANRQGQYSSRFPSPG